jgi:hypothetical protein
VEKRYKDDAIHILGYSRTSSALTCSRIEFEPVSRLETVSCHLCVLNAHRLHERDCSHASFLQPRCSCLPRLSYEMYDRYDVETFLAHLKLRHLEYFERFRNLWEMFLPKETATQWGLDVWQVQKLIRERFGIGDDL